MHCLCNFFSHKLSRNGQHCGSTRLVGSSEHTKPHNQLRMLRSTYPLPRCITCPTFFKTVIRRYIIDINKLQNTYLLKSVEKIRIFIYTNVVYINYILYKERTFRSMSASCKVTFRLEHGSTFTSSACCIKLETHYILIIQWLVNCMYNNININDL